MVAMYEDDAATDVPTEQFWHHNAGPSGFGGSSYIDDVVLRDRATGAEDEGILDERVYYLQNWHHDVVALVDTSGGIVERANYDGYGMPIGTLSTNGNRRGYAGYEIDPELAGHWHVRHRVLRSDLGVWTRRDPLGYVGGLNVSAYVRSDPISATDPFGLFRTTGGDEPWWVRGCAREAGSFQECQFCCYYNSDGRWHGYAANCVANCEEAFSPWVPPPPPPPPTEEDCLNPWLTKQPDKSSCYEKYGLCDCLYGANVRCMCLCMGNSPWEDFVRGCLQCMLRVPGMTWDRAHILCWLKATEHFGIPSVPARRLRRYVRECSAYQRATCGGKCDPPPLPPGPRLGQRRASESAAGEAGHAAV